jgi:cell fate regulator YaaT (PSP1 superfamily)
MPEVVGVRFKPVTKIYYFLPLPNTTFKLNDPVIVETSRGEELGWIAMEVKEITNQEVKGTLKPILRKANPLDLIKMQEYQAQEAPALEKCREKVVEMGLPMKVIQAEYSYDGSRLLFLFTSEQRVDFRALVRYLVRSFHTRVEMRQIGARDEAKIIDGYGRCGRQLCCSSWLTDFHPVSIRMAKNQQLPLAPTEISGLCGRLLCCLAYEDYMYKELRKNMPKTGTIVDTTHGKGKVKGLNILKESIIVEIGEDSRLEIPMSDIKTIPQSKPKPPPRKSKKKKRRSKKKSKKKETP